MWWIDLISAIGTIGAVCAAVIIAIVSQRSTARQFLQSRYDSARPILIAEAYTPFLRRNQPPFNMSANNADWLDWNAGEQWIVVQNVGNGPAFSINAVLYGPASVVISQQTPGAQTRSTQEKDIHWSSWQTAHLLPYDKEPDADKKKLQLQMAIGASHFTSQHKSIGKYSFNAPDQPFFVLLNPPKTYVARVTLTYLDMFKRKHASIFDIDNQGHWYLLEHLENIKKDLDDLEGMK